MIDDRARDRAAMADALQHGLAEVIHPPDIHEMLIWPDARHGSQDSRDLQMALGPME